MLLAADGLQQGQRLYVEQSLVRTVAGVKMRRRIVAVVEGNDDSEEAADFRRLVTGALYNRLAMFRACYFAEW
jgi:hypothetical protein